MEKHTSRLNGIVVSDLKPRLHLPKLTVPKYVLPVVAVILSIAVLSYGFYYDHQNIPKKIVLTHPPAQQSQAIATSYKELQDSNFKSSTSPSDQYQYYVGQAANYQSQGQYASAISSMKSAKQTGVTITYDYYMTLGNIYGLAGQKSNAISAYNSAISLIKSDSSLSSDSSYQLLTALQGLIEANR